LFPASPDGVSHDNSILGGSPYPRIRLEGSAVAKLVQLWNPRSRHYLRRYWISFKDRIVIRGESVDQMGVLAVLPRGRDGLRAHLQVMGSEFMEAVAPGNDLVVWINGLELLVGVRAVEDERMLVSFGVAQGAKVSVRLEPGIGRDAQPMAMGDADVPDLLAFPRSSGLCQTLNA
jgi:hypothetical protein